MSNIWEKLAWMQQFTPQQLFSMTKEIMDSLPEVDPKTGKYVIQPSGGEQQNASEG